MTSSTVTAIPPRAGGLRRRLPTNHRLVLLALGLLVCGASLCLPGCKQCGSDEVAGPDAAEAEGETMRLTGLKGTVEWRSDKDGQWKKATEGQLIETGSKLRTAKDSQVEVVFSDGRKLSLKAESELSLQDLEGEFALMLEEGEIETESEGTSGKGFKMAFGDSKETVDLREGSARFKLLQDGDIEMTAKPTEGGGFKLSFADDTDIDMQREGSIRLTRGADGMQVQMLFGEATMTRAGETESVKEGEIFAMKIRSAKMAGREFVATTLRDTKRIARIRPPGASSLSRPRKRTTVLKPGTTVHVRGRKGSVELTDKAGGKVVLLAGAMARFDGAFHSKRGRGGILLLDTGKTRILLHRQGGEGAEQEVLTTRAKILVSAQGLTAEVTVINQPKSTQVSVYSGKADVKVGGKTITVNAGYTLILGPGGGPAEPAPLARSRIRAREGQRTRVFYDRRINSVAFSWRKAEDDAPVMLEVSPSASLAPLLLREPIAGNSFTLANLQRNRYYWRVVRRPSGGGAEKPGKVGSVEIGPDPTSRRRSSGSLTNIINDTGAQTKISFQGRVPALTFKWNAAKGAAAYIVRIYEGDDLETPAMQKRIAKANLVLPAGKLKEGSYFWYQAAITEGGKEFKSSQMNKLVLVFDNTTTLMRIDDPQPGTKPRNGKVDVRGLAMRGAKVSVDNRPVHLLPDGRFDQSVSGVSPGSVMLFRLRKHGVGDVYYVRHLGK